MEIKENENLPCSVAARNPKTVSQKKKVTQNEPEYMVAFSLLFPCFQSWVLLKFER